MFASKRREAHAHDLSNSERFVTTYCHDFKPISERCPQLNRKTQARPAPVSIGPPQSNHETWPVFFQHFYNTTNSAYGSAPGSQPLLCSLLPAFSPSFGILTPSISEATGGFGSTLTEARTQEARVAGETGLSLTEEDKADVWKQREAKDEPQWKADVVYEEGVIVVSTHDDPSCCEDFIRNLCREAGLCGPLSLPVASRPAITNKDAENWENSAYLWGWSPAVGLHGSTFLQPSPWQCSCCAWKPQQSGGCCFETQTVPAHVAWSSAEPPARVQPTNYRTEPDRTLLTEYQANYAAEWAKPKIQQSHCLPPCRWSHHPFL